MRIYIVLTYLISLYAVAGTECLQPTTTSEVKRLKYASQQLVDKQCFSEDVAKSFVTRYSTKYCEFYSKCNALIEKQIGNGVEYKNQLSNAPGPSFFIPKDKLNVHGPQFTAKVVEIYKNKLQKMSDLLTVLNAYHLQLPSDSCPYLDKTFDVPKDNNLNPNEKDLIITARDVYALKANSAITYNKCNAQGIKKCKGFFDKNDNEWKAQIIDNIKSLCVHLPSVSDLMQMSKSELVDTAISFGEVEPPLKKVTTNIEEDLGEGYEKYLKDSGEINYFSRNEERKHIITYFTALEAVRCKTKITYTETESNKDKFRKTREAVYATTNEAAKKKNDKIVPVQQRNYNEKVDSLFTAFSSSLITPANLGAKMPEQETKTIPGNSKPIQELAGLPVTTQQQQSSMVQNAVIDNGGMPGVHEPVQDQYGVPNYPVAIPAQSQKKEQQITNTVGLSPEVQALQSKLSDTQKKLEDTQAKLDEEKTNVLKNQVKQLNEEKVRLQAELDKQKSFQPAQVIAASNAAMVSTPMQSMAPIQQLSNTNVTSEQSQQQILQPQSAIVSGAQKISTASVAKSINGASGIAGSGDVSGNGNKIVIQEYSGVLKGAGTSEGFFEVPESILPGYLGHVKDHNSDDYLFSNNGKMYAVAALKKEDGSIVYVAREIKKPAKTVAKPAPKIRVPASVKPDVQTIKRADLIGTMNGAK